MPPRLIPFVGIVISLLAFSLSVNAAEIDTNEVHCAQAPAWLSSSQVDRVVERMQDKLEWDIRKIQLVWHTDQAEFQKAHGFDEHVLAFTRPLESTVHLGPRVKNLNFDAVFGHELVHVILFQKYKGAVPKWLEEGMANYLSNHEPMGSGKTAAADPALWKVDYAWLAAQPEVDVLTLRHPFSGVSVGGALYHYQASQALMEMIATHCSVTDLLQLSVGKKLESYLPTFCGMSDINAEFRKWVASKAKSKL